MLFNDNATLTNEDKLMSAVRSMMNRGAPDKIDDAGFNKMSYSAMLVILKKGEFYRRDYERMAYHLIRHSGQMASIGVDIEWLKAFHAKLAAFPVDIFFNPESKQIKLVLAYNTDHIAALRGVPSMSYRDGANYFHIHAVFELARTMIEYFPEFGKALGRVLKSYGYDVPRIKAEYGNDILRLKKERANKLALIGANKSVSGEPSADDRPVVMIDWRSDLEMMMVKNLFYHAPTVAAIKSLEGKARSYDKDSRAWRVMPTHHTLLLENLSKADVQLIDNMPPNILAAYPQHQIMDYSSAFAAIDTREALEIVTSQYSVIGDKKQYLHQLEGEAFMLSVGSCINADDMGLGKAAQTIISTHIQRQRHDNRPVLIVVPASIKTNWVRELFMWLGADAGVVQVVNNQKNRTYMYSEQSKSRFTQVKLRQENARQFGLSYKGVKDTVKADYLIIGYDILEKNREALIEWQQRTNALALIADEAHYLKNMTSQRTKAMLGYSKMEKAHKKEGAIDRRTEKEKAAPAKKVKVPGIAKNFDIVYPLTGTPNTGKNIDVMPLAMMIRHPIVDDVKYFKNRYCGPESNRFGVTFDGSTNSEELYGLLASNMIQRRKKDVMSDMPDKNRIFRYVDIDLKEYWQIWDNYVATYEERTGKTFNEDCAHLTELNVLRNVASGLKIPQVLELADEVLASPDGKLSIFTGYTATANAIMEHYGPEMCLRIVGGMTDKQRDDVVQKFQNDPQYRVIICNYKAAAVGLTLTASTTAIMADLMWLPSDHFQAEDRQYRIGQKNNVTIYYLIATGTHEESVKRIVDEKALVIDVMEQKNYEFAASWKEVLAVFLEEEKALREQAA